MLSAIVPSVDAMGRPLLRCNILLLHSFLSDQKCAAGGNEMITAKSCTLCVIKSMRNKFFDESSSSYSIMSLITNTKIVI